MPCLTTCMVSFALIISMIYFQNATAKSEIIQEYKKQLAGDVFNVAGNVFDPSSLQQH